MNIFFLISKLFTNFDRIILSFEVNWDLLRKVLSSISVVNFVIDVFERNFSEESRVLINSESVIYSVIFESS